MLAIMHFLLGSQGGFNGIEVDIHKLLCQYCHNKFDVKEKLVSSQMTLQQPNVHTVVSK